MVFKYPWRVQEKLESSLKRVLGWGLITTTLLVTPQWALDPINPVKMLAVVTTGFMCLGLLLVNRKSVDWSKYKLSLSLISTFVVWQILVVLISSGEIYQQFFGSNGRNTGFITYIGLSLVFVGSIVSSNPKVLNQFVKIFIFIGSTSIGYGLIQALDKDPIKWVNKYSKVIGFLGNPNFQSSLLGILGTVIFGQVFIRELKSKFKGLIGLYLLVTLYVIKETHSQQGFLVLALGIGIVLGLYIFKLNRRLGFVYTLMSFFGFFLVLFGTLNRGPLSSILYKDSVTYRGDYWRAGWRMTLDHPFLGVGMDSYGDWYRRSRTLAATLRRGPDTTSNAAHNVYLDISSFGGFPLLVIYVVLMVLVFVSAVRVLKRTESFNPVFVSLFAGWIAFQAQSIISINQIGLAIWGWVFSGLIIGFEINTRESDKVEIKVQKNKSVLIPSKSSASSVVAMFVALVLGVVVGMPPLVASTKYRSALESGNLQVIEKAAYIWPLDQFRMIQVAMTLDQNKLESQGLKIALDAVAHFPDSYPAWATLNKMMNASAKQKALALTQMKRLDPHNPNLK